MEDFEAINTVMCFEAYDINPYRQMFSSVLDLGANIGIATRFFLSKLSGITIFAMEPSAENCSLFKANIALANASNKVRLWECAVGPADGAGYLEPSDSFRFDSFRVRYFQEEGAPLLRQATVSIRALADIVKDLTGPVLLKMDIEGCEHSLLACRADWIYKIDYMMIEFHDIGKEKEWVAALLAEGWKSKKKFDTWHFYK